MLNRYEHVCFYFGSDFPFFSRVFSAPFQIRPWFIWTAYLERRIPFTEIYSVGLCGGYGGGGDELGTRSNCRFDDGVLPHLPTVWFADNESFNTFAGAGADGLLSLAIVSVCVYARAHTHAHTHTHTHTHTHSHTNTRAYTQTHSYKYCE